LKWPSVIVAAIAGVGLMFLLGFLFGLVVGEASFGGTLVISIISYFSTGFISGYLANWKGATYGAWAAFLLYVFNLSIAIILQAKIGYIQTFSLLEYLMILVFAGIGALGGFLGERIRTEHPP